MTKLCTVPNWTEVAPPPPPYLFVLRRSFPNGLHVFVLAYENKGIVRIDSAIDHGTARGSRFAEGPSSPQEDIADFIMKICSRWDQSEAARTSAWRRRKSKYYYTKTDGTMGGPVYRNTLFELIASGEITWDAQAWEEMPDVMFDGKSTGWSPIRCILGIP